MAGNNASDSFKFAYGSCYLIVGLLGLLANVAVVTKVRGGKRMKSFDSIVLSLSIADGMSGILFVVIGIGIILVTSGIVDFRMVQYAVLGLNFSVLASLNHVVIIVLRNFASAFAHQRSSGTAVVHTLGLAFVWMSACLYGLLSVLVVKNILTLNSIIIVLYNAMSVSLHVVVFCKDGQRCADTEGAKDPARQEQNKKELLHSVLLNMCSVACFFPFGINNLVLKSGLVLGTLCDMLVAANPIADAAVYYYVNRKEKKTMAVEVKASAEPLVGMSRV